MEREGDEVDMIHRDVVRVLKKLSRKKKKKVVVRPSRYDKVYYKGLEWLSKL